MNTIHGRAAAIATGAKVANPDLTVWQVSGDGDGLAIGGNHFIHANRRNINLNMILLNNRIYGLTKGQYSPTSPRGFVSKSSPYGTVEDPFRPAELCFGARGHFFARTVATDGAHTVEVLKAANAHKGASVTEVLQSVLDVRCITLYRVTEVADVTLVAKFEFDTLVLHVTNITSRLVLAEVAWYRHIDDHTIGLLDEVVNGEGESLVEETEVETEVSLF